MLCTIAVEPREGQCPPVIEYEKRSGLRFLGGWAGWSLPKTQTGDATTHSLRLFPDVVQGAARRDPDLQSRQTSQPDVGPDTGITALSHLGWP